MQRLAIAICAVLGLSVPAAARDLSKDAVNEAQFSSEAPGRAVSPQILKAEVLLDRAQTSPGVIDGKAGDNFRKAVAAFAETHGLPAGDALTEPLWQALVKDGAPVLVDYRITDKDVAYPFIAELPTDFGKMAKLKSLGYVDAAEMLAERFHMDARLLKALNPDAKFDRAGTTIVVAAVAPHPVDREISRINVDKPRGQVRALDAKGKLIVAFPATIGSDETPSPSGTYKVKAVAFNPVYTYNPEKNFKQGDNNEVLKIAPGPNNPVGSVFIALDKPTFGLHGTPDPEKIDKTGSHGCVRMTNWDAETLAHAVKKGVPVAFVD